MKRRTLGKALTGAAQSMARIPGIGEPSTPEKTRRRKIQSGPVQLKTAQPITTPTLPFARRRP